MNKEELRQELEEREIEEMTNGELIRTLFPDGIYDQHRDEICVYLRGDGCLYFSLEWWNAEFAFNWQEDASDDIIDRYIKEEVTNE